MITNCQSIVSKNEKSVQKSSKFNLRNVLGLSYIRLRWEQIRELMWQNHNKKLTRPQLLWYTLLVLSSATGISCMIFFMRRMYEPIIIIKVIEFGVCITSIVMMSCTMVWLLPYTPLLRYSKTTVVTGMCFTGFILFLAWS